MKKKINNFKKGQVVRSGNNAVLVTGPGTKTEGYKCFSGVVIMDNKSDDYSWPVGMYSDSWTFEAFKLEDIKLSKLVSDYLNY